MGSSPMAGESVGFVSRYHSGYFLSTQDTKSLCGLFYQNLHLQSIENSIIYDLVSVRIASSARYFPF